MAQHRFQVGDRVVVIKQDPHGFPAPIGTELVIARLDDDGWYRTAEGSRIGPEEVDYPGTPRMPTYLSVPVHEWVSLCAELDRLRSSARPRVEHHPPRNYGSNWADALEG